MLVISSINHNAALAKDEEGRELVIFGRGVGFPKTPYQLEDESIIQRTFRHVNDDLLQTISSISEDVLGVAMDVVKVARADLNCTLNPNLYLTLADHLQFSANRIRDGIIIENPLSTEIPYIYAKEWEVGKKGLDLMFEATGVSLPESEAASIALHLVNAEADSAGGTRTIREAMQCAKTVEEIVGLVEKKLSVELDRSSHGYRRFVAHLRYLIQRLRKGEEVESADGMLLDQIAKDFPESYKCAQLVGRYLKRTYGWRLSNEERLYLMMYISRLVPRGSR